MFNLEFGSNSLVRSIGGLDSHFRVKISVIWTTTEILKHLC